MPAKPAAVLDYYFRARGGEKHPLNEAKLILVGRGAVGKYRAQESRWKNETRVVPVLVRAVNWKVSPEVSKLTAIPKDGKPVPGWLRKDEAWRDVSERAQKVKEEMRGVDPLRRRSR
jgi:hypothetical protein